MSASSRPHRRSLDHLGVGEQRGRHIDAERAGGRQIDNEFELGGLLITHDDLKWGRDSPLKKVGTFDELEPEARTI